MAFTNLHLATLYLFFLLLLTPQLSTSSKAESSRLFATLKQQKQGKAAGSCDFKGVATITTTDPSKGSCIFPGSKQASNVTRQVVNSTHVSGAAERLKFIGFSSKRPSRIGWLLYVISPSLLFFTLH